MLGPEERYNEVIVCPDCQREKYTLTLPLQGLTLNRSQWDGTDFFKVWPYPVFVFIAYSTPADR